MNNFFYTYIPTVLFLSSLIVISGCSSDDSNDDNIETPDTSTGKSGSFSQKTESPVLDFSNTTAYWDMESNSVVTENDDWEIAIRVANRDYQLLINGGASGNGSAGVGVLQLKDAFEVTDPTDTNQVYQYFGDAVTGALSTPGSYGPFEYSVEGNHKMWPTYATYLVKDNSENYYKFQVLGNYGEDGAKGSGNLVVRYESSVSGIATAPLDASDASQAAKFDLQSGLQTTEDDWHVAYQRYTGFKLNGGDSGTAGVIACVVHSYPELYDEENNPAVDSFKSLSSETTRGDFENVAMSEDACIDDSGMAEDSLQPQIKSEQWLLADYSTGAPVFSSNSESSNGWIIRSAGTDDNGEHGYARIAVKTLTIDLSGAPERQIVLETEAWEKNQE